MTMTATSQFRRLDDQIFNTLNTTVLTTTFHSKGSNPTQTCRDLFDEITTRSTYRHDLIEACLNHTNDLMNQKDLSEVKRKHLVYQRRQIQSEKNIEKVISDNTEKAFYERCRDYFSPQSSSK
ncbi:unnamed protein product [Didymodactylos carnosus]|uniref:Protein MIX23 n=1 Tax=Didymodactylos carnosus TaxID=1234261 RepID=A0A813SBL4_9BILA|nr:unnamed protein product [Didymodactylos carnosus]CAF0792276.1 unnamed protein product [Didymodactylos carnosus]CAF3518550.1 unnamed protein product [Didymodactylos carnosus]CAF3576529.1 unnamed protein product [Didymodactylos carnosus]